MTIRELAQAKNKSVAQIAREVNVDPNYLYRKFSEEGWSPRTGLAVKLAKALDTTVEELWPNRDAAA